MMKGSENVLIKYKDIEDTTEYGFIEAVYSDSPVEVIQLTKLVDSIKLGDDWYKYESTEFIPTNNNENVDALYVYVDLIGVREE